MEDLFLWVAPLFLNDSAYLSHRKNHFYFNLHVLYSQNYSDRCDFYYVRFAPKFKKKNLKNVNLKPLALQFTNFPNFCPSTAIPFMRNASCFEILSGKSHVPLKFPHGFAQVLLITKHSLVNVIEIISM